MARRDRHLPGQVHRDRATRAGGDANRVPARARPQSPGPSGRVSLPGVPPGARMGMTTATGRQGGGGPE